VVSQLKLALQNGAVQGSVGNVQLDDVDVDALETAIQYAIHTGCRTANAAQMLATAQFVQRLRQAMLSADMVAAREMLSLVKGKALSPVAAVEVQLVQQEVDNWVVVSELSAAVSSGMAVVRRRPQCTVLCATVPR
jgi:hypothetical protein